MIRQTSLLAFEDILQVVTSRHREYMVALRGVGHPATDFEVTRFAGRSDPNYFRPRRNELVKVGVIREAGKRRCSITGKTALTWWFV